MIEIIVLACRLSLIIVFSISSISKFRDFRGTTIAVKDFGFPSVFVPFIAITLPIVELLTAILLCINKTAWLGGILSTLLMISFIVLVGNVIRLGKEMNCNCFGQKSNTPTGWNTIYRNISLLMLSILVVVYSSMGWQIESILLMTIDQWSIFIISAIILYQGFLTTQLLDSRTTHQKSIMTIEDTLFSGLPVGSKAPYFKLDNHLGKPVSLHDLLVHQNPIVLFFTSPNCPACNALFPNAVEWHTQYKEKLTFVFVSFKGEKNASLETLEGVNFLVPKDGHVPLELFKTREVPTAVHITPDGRIGNRPANGGENIAKMMHHLIDIQEKKFN